MRYGTKAQPMLAIGRREFQNFADVNVNLMSVAALISVFSDDHITTEVNENLASAEFLGQSITKKL